MPVGIRLEQSAPGGQQTIGTGFLISARSADGSPQTILVTANHVFVDMKGPKAEVGYRIGGSGGSWTPPKTYSGARSGLIQ